MIVDYCLAIGELNAIVRGSQDVVSVRLWGPGFMEVSNHYFIELFRGPTLKSLDGGAAIIRIGRAEIKLRFSL